MASTRPVPETRTRDRKDVLRDPEVQKAAARLRLVTDRKQGKNSPQWVRDLAETAPTIGRR